jgi:hypothetical protein
MIRADGREFVIFVDREWWFGHASFDPKAKLDTPRTGLSRVYLSGGIEDLTAIAADYESKHWSPVYSGPLDAPYLSSCAAALVGEIVSDLLAPEESLIMLRAGWPGIGAHAEEHDLGCIGPFPGHRVSRIVGGKWTDETEEAYGLLIPREKLTWAFEKHGIPGTANLYVLLAPPVVGSEDTSASAPLDDEAQADAGIVAKVAAGILDSAALELVVARRQWCAMPDGCHAYEDLGFFCSPGTVDTLVGRVTSAIANRGGVYSVWCDDYESQMRWIGYTTYPASPPCLTNAGEPVERHPARAEEQAETPTLESTDSLGVWRSRKMNLRPRRTDRGSTPPASDPSCDDEPRPQREVSDNNG